jgi:hypothetical protein
LTNLLDSALALAAEGVAVFPCGEDKRPLTANGFKDATTDPDVIAGWTWDGMIGATIPEGQIVVDVDPRNGGDATMAALKDAGMGLPISKLVTTKSGGRHHYLAVEDTETLRGKLGGGVDIKKPGKGYVIVPPSSGYKLAVPAEVAPAPEWLVSELKGSKHEVSGEAADAKFFEQFQEGTSYGKSALERELGIMAMTREGGRNDQLNKSSFQLAQLVAGGELSETLARDELARMALQIGLEPEETAKTIESGWRDGILLPRQAPERTQPGEAEASAVPWHNSLPAEEDETEFWTDWDIDEPEVPWLLRPLIPRNAYILVYGATEASKSMVWMGITSRLSHSGVRTSFYSLENPPHTDRSRLRRLKPLKGNFRCSNRVIDLSDTKQLIKMAEREKEAGTDIIVLDTYSHAFQSYSDDGNAKAIDFARRGCSVVVIDHTGYVRDDEPRDASAKRQQVDMAVLMKKVGQWAPGRSAQFMMENKKAARFANPFLINGEIADTEAGKGLEIRWSGNTKVEWP